MGIEALTKRKNILKIRNEHRGESGKSNILLGLTKELQDILLTRRILEILCSVIIPLLLYHSGEAGSFFSLVDRLH